MVALSVQRSAIWPRSMAVAVSFDGVSGGGRTDTVTATGPVVAVAPLSSRARAVIWYVPGAGGDQVHSKRGPLRVIAGAPSTKKVTATTAPSGSAAVACTATVPGTNSGSPGPGLSSVMVGGALGAPLMIAKLSSTAPVSRR